MKEIKTFTTLLKEVKENLEKYDNLDLVEEYTCVELIDDDMLETIEKFAIDNVKVTPTEYRKLTAMYGYYSDYSYITDIEKLKIELTIDTLDYNLAGMKKTILQIKRKALKKKKKKKNPLSIHKKIFKK